MTTTSPSSSDHFSLREGHGLASTWRDDLMTAIKSDSTLSAIDFAALDDSMDDTMRTKLVGLLQKHLSETLKGAIPDPKTRKAYIATVLESTQSALESLSTVADGEDEQQAFIQYLADLQGALQDSTIADAMMQSGHAEFIRSFSNLRVQNPDELKKLLKQAKRGGLDTFIGVLSTVLAVGVGAAASAPAVSGIVHSFSPTTHLTGLTRFGWATLLPLVQVGFLKGFTAQYVKKTLDIKTSPHTPSGTKNTKRRPFLDAINSSKSTLLLAFCIGGIGEFSGSTMLQAERSVYRGDAISRATGLGDAHKNVLNTLQTGGANLQGTIKKFGADLHAIETGASRGGQSGPMDRFEGMLLRGETNTEFGRLDVGLTNVRSRLISDLQSLTVPSMFTEPVNVQKHIIDLSVPLDMRIAALTKGLTKSLQKIDGDNFTHALTEMENQAKEVLMYSTQEVLTGIDTHKISDRDELDRAIHDLKAAMQSDKKKTDEVLAYVDRIITLHFNALKDAEKVAIQSGITVYVQNPLQIPRKPEVTMDTKGMNDILQKGLPNPLGKGIVEVVKQSHADGTLQTTLEFATLRFSVVFAILMLIKSLRAFAATRLDITRNRADALKSIGNIVNTNMKNLIVAVRTTWKKSYAHIDGSIEDTTIEKAILGALSTKNPDLTRYIEVGRRRPHMTLLASYVWDFLSDSTRPDAIRKITELATSLIDLQEKIQQNSGYLGELLQREIFGTSTNASVQMDHLNMRHGEYNLGIEADEAKKSAETAGKDSSNIFDRFAGWAKRKSEDRSERTKERNERDMMYMRYIQEGFKSPNDLIDHLGTIHAFLLQEVAILEERKGKQQPKHQETTETRIKNCKLILGLIEQALNTIGVSETTETIWEMKAWNEKDLKTGALDTLLQFWISNITSMPKKFHREKPNTKDHTGRESAKSRWNFGGSDEGSNGNRTGKSGRSRWGFADDNTDTGNNAGSGGKDSSDRSDASGGTSKDTSESDTPAFSVTPDMRYGINDLSNAKTVNRKLLSKFSIKDGKGTAEDLRKNQYINALKDALRDKENFLKMDKITAIQTVFAIAKKEGVEDIPDPT